MLLVDMVFLTKELGLRGVADVAFCSLFYVSPPHFFFTVAVFDILSYSV